MTYSFFTELSDLGIVSIIGEKARAFFQGQITADMNEITATNTRLGAYCNPKGRVIATFRVFEYQGEIHVILPNSMIDLLIEQLKKYAVLSKITLKKNESLSILGAYNTDIAHKLSIGPNDLPQVTDSAFIAKTGEPLLIIKVPDTTGTRFEIVGPRETISQLSEEPLDKFFWRRLDIKSEVPVIFPVTSALFTPHKLNYPALNGVSFKKGCYVGQEIIARTQYLGKSKHHLHYVQSNVDTLPKAGESFEDKTLSLSGIVIDAVVDEVGESHILLVT